jgi:hypothetical protein
MQEAARRAAHHNHPCHPINPLICDSRLLLYPFVAEENEESQMTRMLWMTQSNRGSGPAGPLITIIRVIRSIP